MKAFCIIEGILMALIGLLFLTKPVNSILTFTLIIGIIFVIYGILKFLRLWNKEHKVLHIIMAIIDILFGLILMLMPISAISTLIIYFGIWAVIRGIYTLIYSSKVHSLGFNFSTIYSIIIIIWGIVIAIYPVVVLLILPIIPIIIGIYFIVIAISEIYLGFKIK